MFCYKVNSGNLRSEIEYDGNIKDQDGLKFYCEALRRGKGDSHFLYSGSKLHLKPSCTQHLRTFFTTPYIIVFTALNRISFHNPNQKIDSTAQQRTFFPTIHRHTLQPTSISVSNSGEVMQRGMCFWWDTSGPRLPEFADEGSTHQH